MALPDKAQAQADNQPRLGCWWRSWIAFSLWCVLSMLVLATFTGGWENGVITVLLAAVSYPAILLALGLSIAWVRKGSR